MFASRWSGASSLGVKDDSCNTTRRPQFRIFGIVRISIDVRPKRLMPALGVDVREEGLALIHSTPSAFVNIAG